MRSILAIVVIALMCCTAQIATAAPSITGVSTDRDYFNPNTGSAEIQYGLADIVNGATGVSIYGQSGKVKDFSAGIRSSGNHSISWDGTNGNGVAVPDGEYTILLYLSSIDSTLQPRLVKVFSSITGLDEHIPELSNGTARNSSGYVYTVDTANNSVRIYSPGGSLVSSFGLPVESDGKPVVPIDIAINASDYIFVSDANDARVLVFDPEGRFGSNWQISPEPGADYSYAGPIMVNSSGYLYVVSNSEKMLDNTETPWTPDREFYNHVQVFSPAGELIRSFGSYGSGEDRFGSVSSLAVDRNDNIYLADLLNHRTMILDPWGNFITAIEYSGTGPGDSYSPVGIGIGSAGHIYTVDRDTGRVDVFSPIIADSVKVNVDKTPPLTEALAHGKTMDGWQNTSAGIDLVAEDRGSGVKEIDYRIDDGPVQRITGDSAAFVVTNGVHGLEYWSTDNVGNEGYHQTAVIRVDSVIPTTGATLTGNSGNNGWYRSDVTVNLSSDDIGAGIAATQYSFDGAAWFNDTTFTVSNEGENSVYFRSVDYAGNVESPRMMSVRIDKTAPTIGCSFDGYRPQGWFISGARTTLAPADNESGIDITEYSMDGIGWNTYTSDFTIAPGNLNKVSYRTFDVAGNVATGSSYVYFWPTSIPDIYEVIGNTPVPAQQPSVTVTSIIPVYRLLPSAGATVTPDIKFEAQPDVIDSLPANGTAEKVRTSIRILRIIASFASFLS